MTILLTCQFLIVYSLRKEFLFLIFLLTRQKLSWRSFLSKPHQPSSPLSHKRSPAERSLVKGCHVCSPNVIYSQATLVTQVCVWRGYRWLQKIYSACKDKLSHVASFSLRKEIIFYYLIMANSLYGTYVQWIIESWIIESWILFWWMQQQAGLLGLTHTIRLCRMRQAYDRPAIWLRTIYTRTYKIKYAKLGTGIFGANVLTNGK